MKSNYLQLVERIREINGARTVRVATMFVMLAALVVLPEMTGLAGEPTRCCGPIHSGGLGGFLGGVVDGLLGSLGGLLLGLGGFFTGCFF